MVNYVVGIVDFVGIDGWVDIVSLNNVFVFAGIGLVGVLD